MHMWPWSADIIYTLEDRQTKCLDLPLQLVLLSLIECLAIHAEIEAQSSIPKLSKIPSEETVTVIDTGALTTIMFFHTPGKKNRKFQSSPAPTSNTHAHTNTDTGYIYDFKFVQHLVLFSLIRCICRN